jgi:hypothetical protein
MNGYENMISDKRNDPIKLLSVPEAGRTITASMQNWVEPIAEAFTNLLQAASASGQEERLVERYRLTLRPIVPALDQTPISSELELRLAVSALLCQWLTAGLDNTNSNDLSLEEAETWFLADATNYVPGLILSDSNWIPDDCRRILGQISFDHDFADLFPHVLQIFELIGTDGNRFDKKRKRSYQRATGIIYTPSDVSGFILRETLAPWIKLEATKEDFKCLDPACGTGLFLRTALSVLAGAPSNVGTPPWELVQRLYGMDISPQAIQSSTFVLLAHCLHLSSNCPISPWGMWQLIRSNLCAIDSTTVNFEEVNSATTEDPRALRLQAKLNLLSPSITPETRAIKKSSASYAEVADQVITTEPISLRSIFPEVTNGFSAIFGNPPYSHIRKDQYQAIRIANFRTAPNLRAREASFYPLFVEMMWKFGSTVTCSGGMVLPMSIAYSTSTQIRHLRAAIQEIPGNWRFSFFDRTPDSLFGDDVKTRNAIVLWHRNSRSGQSHFMTGPLMRWNSRNRMNLFRSITYTNLGKCSISKLIPKLGSPQERDIYIGLRSQQSRLESLIKQVPVSKARLEMDQSSVVFYNSTSYNWIPVFQTEPISRNRQGDESTSPSIHAIVCPTQNDAAFVFASLNSRLIYWLWRVEGDGFHVTYDFIRRVPVHPSAFSTEDLKYIQDLAARLWSEMQQNPVVSTNAGRTTVSYYPYICRETLDAIDTTLVRNLGLSSDFISFLRRFVLENILAGREKEVETNPALRRFRTTEDDYEKINGRYEDQRSKQVNGGRVA